MGKVVISDLEKAKRLQLRLQRGELCLGAQIVLSDPAVAEILGRVGYDWLIIDTEHTANDATIVRSMLRAAGRTDAVVLARPLRLDPDEIRRLLDVGSPGVLCPFINTGEEAIRLVQACRYPPLGIRGYGPRRADTYGLDADQYFDHANEAMLCIPIIESQASVENIEDIVRVDGIDAVCIGPMDLSVSLGIPKEYEHLKYKTAYETVRQACRKYKKAMGTACFGLDHAKRCAAEGDTFLLLGGDTSSLVAESRRLIEGMRRGDAQQS
jgi:2-keto-3-deoxy-L-rhamnonate aldolase RhmA